MQSASAEPAQNEAATVGTRESAIDVQKLLDRLKSTSANTRAPSAKASLPPVRSSANLSASDRARQLLSEGRNKELLQHAQAEGQGRLDRLHDSQQEDPETINRRLQLRRQLTVIQQRLQTINSQPAAAPLDAETKQAIAAALDIPNFSEDDLLTADHRLNNTSSVDLREEHMRYIEEDRMREVPRVVYVEDKSTGAFTRVAQVCVKGRGVAG
jgi:hypothetical protein